MSDSVLTMLLSSMVTIVSQAIGYLALRKDLRAVVEEQESIHRRLVAVESRR